MAKCTIVLANCVISFYKQIKRMHSITTIHIDITTNYFKNYWDTFVCLIINKISHYKLSTWRIFRRQFYISEITTKHVYIYFFNRSYLILKHFSTVNMQSFNRKEKKVCYRLIVHRRYKTLAGITTVIIKTTKPKVTIIKRWYLVESCSELIDLPLCDMFKVRSIPLLFGATEESGEVKY